MAFVMKFGTNWKKLSFLMARPSTAAAVAGLLSERLLQNK